MASLPAIDYSRTPLPTISDVARQAGVSTATVSRHLSGQPVRSHAAIVDAISELDFRPSALARSLKSGRTRSIGVAVPDVTNPFFAAVVMGIESACREDGYHVFLCNTEESSEREHSVLSELYGRVDGIILAPAIEDAEAADALRRADVPIVFLDREITDCADFDSVVVDNAGGARQAAEYLLELGHERIAMIGGPLNTTPGRGRHEGFMAALAEAGLEMAPDLLQIGDFRQASGYQAALRLLGIRPAPTAIFAANNAMAMGALHAFHEMHVRLPAELSFLSFDDLELGELLAPPLTTVSRPMREQGVLAMRLLRSRLEEGGDRLERRRTVLATHLNVRGSCAPPPDRRGAPAGPSRPSRTRRT